MKQLLSVAILAVLVPACDSQDDAPRLEGWVNDKPGLLGAEAIRELEGILERYEMQTCHQVVILVVSSTEEESIEAFSLRTANSWGIGHKGLDNGVLVTLAANDKRLRIEIGKGLNNYLTNEEAARIIDRDMVPEFRSGHFGQGFKQGLSSIMKSASRYDIPNSKRPKVCARD